MIKTVINIALVVITLQLSAQKAIKSVASSTCKCINKLNVPINEKLIDSCMTFTLLEQFEDIKKEFDIADTSFMLLMGIEVGKELLTDCDEYYAYTKRNYYKDNRKEKVPDVPKFTTEALLLTVEFGDIAKLIVETSEGKEDTLLWTESFEGDKDYMEHPKFLNKVFRFTWKKIWYYSPETKSYIEKKQITGIELVE